MDFIFRLYNGPGNWLIDDISEITISGITVVSKPEKFGGVCLHKGNQKKFGYTIEIPKPFLKVAGSHSYPELAFKGKYIDIILRNFPRYPCFGQDKHSGPGWSGTPFPRWTEIRKTEFIKLN